MKDKKRFNLIIFDEKEGEKEERAEGPGLQI